MSDPRLYSLWIVPPGDLYDRLRQLIDNVAARYGTPTFEPHVTLAPNLSAARETIAEVAARHAQQIEPFDITLTDLATADSYFYNVFHPVRAPVALDTLHNAVCREPESAIPGPYRPHLSVAYGLTSSEHRQAVAKAFNGSAGVSFSVREFELVETSPALAPHEWRRLEPVFALGAN